MKYNGRNRPRGTHFWKFNIRFLQVCSPNIPASSRQYCNSTQDFMFIVSHTSSKQVTVVTNYGNLFGFCAKVIRKMVKHLDMPPNYVQLFQQQKNIYSICQNNINIHFEPTTKKAFSGKRIIAIFCCQNVCIFPSCGSFSKKEQNFLNRKDV